MKYKYPIIIGLLIIFVALYAIIGNFKKEPNIVKESISESFVSEGIEYTHEIPTNEKQVKVYLFRGHGCTHCYDFLNYVAETLLPKYGKRVTFEIYEVWENADNKNLMKKVGKVLGDNVTGVPYIVIGNKTWAGYDPEWNDEIESKIKEMYKQDINERYDVFVELEKKEQEEANK